MRRRKQEPFMIYKALTQCSVINPNQEGCGLSTAKCVCACESAGSGRSPSPESSAAGGIVVIRTADSAYLYIINRTLSITCG